MRLYLLPLSTRRTLLYAQRLNVTTSPADKGLLNKALGYSHRIWAQWEAKEKGWQRKVVDYGNYAMRRIPFEEWGLKSVPPLSARREDAELKGQEKVELVFPGSVVPLHKAEGIARRLATEREMLHRKSMAYCVAGMPITIPFALVPVIPNLPFFYLVFRAWSHWRALEGGKHVKWLIGNKLLQPSPSQMLDELYQRGPQAKVKLDEGGEDGREERMLLTQKQVREFATKLEIPALSLEMERAIWQVEGAIKAREDAATANAKGGEAEAAAKEEKKD